MLNPPQIFFTGWVFLGDYIIVFFIFYVSLHDMTLLF